MREKLFFLGYETKKYLIDVEEKLKSRVNSEVSFNKFISNLRFNH